MTGRLTANHNLRKIDFTKQRILTFLGSFWARLVTISGAWTKWRNNQRKVTPTVCRSRLSTIREINSSLFLYHDLVPMMCGIESLICLSSSPACSQNGLVSDSYLSCTRSCHQEGWQEDADRRDQSTKRFRDTITDKGRSNPDWVRCDPSQRSSVGKPLMGEPSMRVDNFGVNLGTPPFSVLSAGRH